MFIRVEMSRMSKCHADRPTDGGYPDCRPGFEWVTVDVRYRDACVCTIKNCYAKLTNAATLMLYYIDVYSFMREAASLEYFVRILYIFSSLNASQNFFFQ